MNSVSALSPKSSVFTAAAQFLLRGQAAGIQEYGRGNVNATFLITPADPAAKPFILQRLNPKVFPRPELVMGNLRVLSDHVRRCERRHPPPKGRRWQMPEILPTQDGKDFWLEPQGSLWRALSLIDSTRTYDVIQNDQHAREVGYALGRFHLLVHNLPPARLADTLPGFHRTPGYLQQYDKVLEHCRLKVSPEVTYARTFIQARRGWAAVLEQARETGVLTERVIHGDPKVNNVLLDAATGQAVSLIDLDTVKPGLVQYDLGDCLRSGGNPLGEETTEFAQVRFDLGFCRAILQGYLSQAREFLLPGDYDCMYDAIRLIAFELGLRFFTDYLAGDIYFKTSRPRHNLERALVQFKLTESIAVQETAIRTIIKELH